MIQQKQSESVQKRNANISTNVPTYCSVQGFYKFKDLASPNEQNRCHTFKNTIEAKIIKNTFLIRIFNSKSRPGKSSTKNAHDSSWKTRCSEHVFRYYRSFVDRRFRVLTILLPRTGLHHFDIDWITRRFITWYDKLRWAQFIPVSSHDIADCRNHVNKTFSLKLL